MSDPAVDAAQRAWERKYGSINSPWREGLSRGFIDAAREMAKPIREKHKPVEYYEYDDTNGVFKTDTDGERILMGRVCAECSSQEFLELLGDCELEDCTRYEGERPWPCDTAKLIYTSEELEK
ncbi:MAG TPA: hypothetical protein VHA37_00870 [Candidatus Saccharimonadales bacterium]|nr:hypothetical protein [Candidatus Saccharimonadales bacterium]